MGRPRKYASDAEKQAAYRNRYCIVQGRFRAETCETLKRIAATRDMPVTELLNQLVNFALANRDWYEMPNFTKMLPHATYRPERPRAVQHEEDDDA